MQFFLRSRIEFIVPGGQADEDGICYYFIALDKEKNVFKARQLSAEFQVKKPFIFRATHYRDIDHEDLMKKGHLVREYAEPRLKEKPRVVAIHVSHTAALQHFVDNSPGRWAMIWEEDATFPKGAKHAKTETRRYIRDAEEHLNYDDPQVHFIGHCFAGNGGKRITERLYKNEEKVGPRCRHAYIVNRAGARQLLAASWPMWHNGDEIWARQPYLYFHNDGNLITQRANPDLLRKQEAYREPAMERGVTAVVLNHNRPHNVKECVQSLQQDPLVRKVILLNGKPDTRVTMTGVVALDDFENNKVYGGGRRFLVDAGLISTRAVLFLDDDQAMKEGQIKTLYDAIERGELLVGTWCRECNSKGYNTQSKSNDSVLTSGMVMPRSVLVEYQRAFSSKYEELLRSTRGNGEDLTMNHFVRTVYKRRPKCIPMAQRDLDGSGGYSANAGHYEKRAQICRDLFSGKEKLTAVADNTYWFIYLSVFLALLVLVAFYLWWRANKKILT